jgi:glycosyltransferase involved in cell wall biosynthesis
VLGLTFKENCPDLRNTRVVDIIDALRDYSTRWIVSIPGSIAPRPSTNTAAPTEWQRSRFPAALRGRMQVVHEGIDTPLVAPNPATTITLARAGVTLAAGDEVVTYVARNLEPYRGFHVFMRALPRLLSLRPRARVLIVGGNAVSYGSKPAGGRTWRETLTAEVGAGIDATRVHFLDRLPYAAYLQVLQVSAVHAYLTYPFVLSWSLLEAMSAGCMVVGSRTAPVEEVISHGQNGWLTDFFDHQALADSPGRGTGASAPGWGISVVPHARPSSSAMT